MFQVWFSAGVLAVVMPALIKVWGQVGALEVAEVARHRALGWA